MQNVDEMILQKGEGIAHYTDKYLVIHDFNAISYYFALSTNVKIKLFIVHTYPSHTYSTVEQVHIYIYVWPHGQVVWGFARKARPFGSHPTAQFSVNPNEFFHDPAYLAQTRTTCP